MYRKIRYPQLIKHHIRKQKGRKCFLNVKSNLKTFHKCKIKVNGTDDISKTIQTAVQEIDKLVQK